MQDFKCVCVCVCVFALVCEGSDVPSSASTSLPSGDRMLGSLEVHFSSARNKTDKTNIICISSSLSWSHFSG